MLTFRMLPTLLFRNLAGDPISLNKSEPRSPPSQHLFSIGPLMPVTECGFQGSPGVSTLKLIQYGPTLSVQVGFDPSFTIARGSQPHLPGPPRLAVVDTGATISCIDTELALSLRLPLVGTQRFGGIDGLSDRPMHLAQIVVPDLNYTIYGGFAAVDLIAGGQPHAVLLGRSFLRAFRMIYDGRTGGVVIENESPH